MNVCLNNDLVFTEAYYDEIYCNDIEYRQLRWVLDLMRRLLFLWPSESGRFKSILTNASCFEIMKKIHFQVLWEIFSANRGNGLVNFYAVDRITFMELIFIRFQLCQNLYERLLHLKIILQSLQRVSKFFLSIVKQALLQFWWQFCKFKWLTSHGNPLLLFRVYWLFGGLQTRCLPQNI